MASDPAQRTAGEGGKSSVQPWRANPSGRTWGSSSTTLLRTPPPPSPGGRCGKAWALHHGVLASGGEALMFLDADTEPGPKFLE
jgi:hypothetical protein